MKHRGLPPFGAPRGRRIAGRAQDEHVIDTYMLKHKLPEPTRCPKCGAVYEHGRWIWTETPPKPTHEDLCSACQRILDDYPAGIVTLTGDTVGTHRAELIALARHAETAERSEHPMNRIMAIAELGPETMVITTTDIHLPRRIGDAVEHAYKGTLSLKYAGEGYFVRVDWNG